MDWNRVIVDYKLGVIDSERWALAIDNDDGYWDYVGDFDRPDEEIAEERDKLTLEYGTPNGLDDIIEILWAIGVPAHHC